MPDDVHDTWERNAAFWDEYIGPEGNFFHRELVAPAQMRLLDLKPGERVLDIACGNGQFAREMARGGAHVLAFDLSETLIERAKAHTEAAGLTDIEFRVGDATDPTMLGELGDHDFDAAVCTMGVMDMSDIEPLLRALPGLLKPGGRFVFSVQHPCFNSTGAAMITEDVDGETVPAVTVTAYLNVLPERTVGIVGQPEPHPYFHRPISELLNLCFRHGFVVDGFEEPAHTDAQESEDRLRWRSYTQIPPVLVVRARLTG